MSRVRKFQIHPSNGDIAVPCLHLFFPQNVLLAAFENTRILSRKLIKPTISVVLSSVSDDSEDSVLEEPIQPKTEDDKPKNSLETPDGPRELDPAELGYPKKILVPLQESFSKFDESRRLLEEKFQSNEINEGEDWLDMASEGEPAEGAARVIKRTRSL